MDLGEPQEREYEAPNAKSEHNYNHLTDAKIPPALSKIRGDGSH
jgi:hypothetical protein